VPYADAMLVPLPPGVDPAAAASVADNVCDAYRHVAAHVPRLLERDGQTRVIIVSAVTGRNLYSSSIPLYAGLFAQELGAGEVWLADSRPHIRDAATALGLNAIEPNELRGLDRAPLTVDVSTSGRGLHLAVSCTDHDGTCTSTGSLARRATVPALEMYLRAITLKVGHPHVRSVIPHVLADMAAGRLHPERVTTALGSLDDAPAVLSAHYRGGGIKAVLLAD
jgi:alcohol dehydrogenase